TQFCTAPGPKRGVPLATSLMFAFRFDHVGVSYSPPLLMLPVLGTRFPEGPTECVARAISKLGWIDLAPDNEPVVTGSRGSPRADSTDGRGSLTSPLVPGSPAAAVYPMSPNARPKVAIRASSSGSDETAPPSSKLRAWRYLYVANRLNAAPKLSTTGLISCCQRYSCSVIKLPFASITVWLSSLSFSPLSINSISVGT